ncbi:MAG: hypothetical protein IKW04_05520, partial [Clostridia bacterium]|nr:hypothetical protein [Clostridia bacterium]
FLRRAESSRPTGTEGVPILIVGAAALSPPACYSTHFYTGGDGTPPLQIFTLQGKRHGKTSMPFAVNVLLQTFHTIGCRKTDNIFVLSENAAYRVYASERKNKKMLFYKPTPI